MHSIKEVLSTPVLEYYRQGIFKTIWVKIRGSISIISMLGWRNDRNSEQHGIKS